MFAIGFAPLSTEAQRIVAAQGDEATVAELSCSPYLDPQVATRLTAHRETSVKLRALRRADDSTLVTTVAKGTGRKAEAAIRNPRVDADVLAEALAGSNLRKALGAYCNPSTPLEARRAALTPARAADLVIVGGNVGGQGDRAIRGQALALANPWVADTADTWCSYIRRGIALLPLYDEDVIASIKGTQSFRWPGFDKHPAFTGKRPDGLTPVELLADGSAVFDMIAVDHPHMTEQLLADTFAARYGQRTQAPRSNSFDYQVDYLLLAKAIARFGPTVAAPIAGDIAGTRRVAAAWFAPAAAFIGQARPADLADATLAAQTLGTDVTHWQTFLKLAPQWQGTASELAVTATKV